MDVFTNTVLIHAAKGQFDTALEKCNAQMKLFTDNQTVQAIIYNMQGNLYLAQRKNDLAEKSYESALKANANYMQPYYALGRLYLFEKKEKKAIAQYEAILEKNPKQAGPHMLLGTIYDIQKRFDKSEKHYRSALEINPEFAPAANNLAYLLASQDKNIDEALNYAKIAKEKIPDDPGVMDTLGWVYYKKGLNESAIHELKESVEKKPDNATIRYHLGMAYLKSGDKDRAKTNLEKALNLDDKFENADEVNKILSDM